MKIASEYMVLKNTRRIINYSKYNLEPDSKDGLIEIITKELIDQEFHIINKKSNQIFFSRNQIGKGDPSDKLGVYRRVQFKGEYDFFLKDKEIEIIIQLNFTKQLTVIFLGLAFPFIAFIFINGADIISTALVYFLISFIWFYFSRNMGINLSDSIISKSIRKL